jgi:hypothetical protein
MHKMSLFGRQSYRTVVLVDSPSVYYRLGDSSAPAVKDAGAGGVNAAMNGTVTFGQTGALVGDSDKAVLFSGLAGNDLATAATPGSAYDLGDGPWSIEFWYKTSVINTQQDLIGKGTNAYIVRISSNNKFSIVKSGSPAVLVFNTTAAFTDTTRWHHVVITRVAATKPHIYVDGVDQTGVYTAATFSDTTTAFRMGESTLTGSPYTGLLDEVAIYKSVLSQARVTAHYNAGT